MRKKKKKRSEQSSMAQQVCNENAKMQLKRHKPANFELYYLRKWANGRLLSNLHDQSVTMRMARLLNAISKTLACVGFRRFPQ